jgi:3-hydroxyacyl-[acyl-carrier-protein] dehydratase
MLSTSEIKKVLPHRYPMLLVDRVTELEPGLRLTAHKAVTCNEPWYQELAADGDHGYPEVLLIESWCQSAGVLAVWDRPNPDVLSGHVMLFGGMAGIRFLAPVMPGDLLEHHVRLVRALSDTVIFEGGTVVGSRAVMEVGRVVMAVRPASKLATASALIA